MREKYLKNIKRIVIKVGTSSLTTNIKIDPKKIKKLVKEIVKLLKHNYEVLLVTSGATTSGIGTIGLTNKPHLISEKRAAASIGQTTLMTIYHKMFSKYHIKVGQILLTENDLKQRDRYLNAKDTINTLLKKYKVLPIINENDAVGVEEIIFGDNDVLSALVANLIDADLLIILTNIEGFYKNGNLLKEVPKITEDLFAAAGKENDQFSIGGMKTKLQAAKICVTTGIPVIIASSKEKDILKRILNCEEIGTFFYPYEKPLTSKKRWIAYSVASTGKIIVDDGAKDALINHGKSLLPRGIIKCEGDFKKGDHVDIIDINGNKIGRGKTNYSMEVIEEIKKLKTEQIKQKLKDKFSPEVIHRDNMVIY